MDGAVLAIWDAQLLALVRGHYLELSTPTRLKRTSALRAVRDVDDTFLAVEDVLKSDAFSRAESPTCATGGASVQAKQSASDHSDVIGQLHVDSA